MSPKSDQNKLIDWLNTLIMMAQWDKTLPLYFARLYEEPNQYQAALQVIREPTPESPPPPGDALNPEEWRSLYRVTTRAESLRKLFAGDNDPFFGAPAEGISVLAEVSDLTTDPQAMFYSQNGTFQLVLESVRQRPELNTVELITDGLNKFYTLLDTNETIAEDLYKLACSNDWHLVLASLHDVRCYTTDENVTAKQSLDQWNRKLTTELRSIILKPAKLYRVPKKLIKLAWEMRDLFAHARNRVPFGTSQPEFEIRQQVANIAYPLFVNFAQSDLGAIESELQLLATVARHFISVRKFAKLDGLVYAWPRIASLAMANYANLEYVEDFFVERKPRPTVDELEARDARELYELCENNGGVIRFLRLRPHFKEIDENELRRYRPLAPVTVSDPSQPPPPPPVIPLQPPSPAAAPVVQSVSTPTRTCRLLIQPTSTIPAGGIERAEIEYDVSMFVGNLLTSKGRVTFSIRELLDRILGSLAVKREESLHAVVKELFATGREQIIARAGSELFETFITRPVLTENLNAAFRGDEQVRFVIVSELEELQYLPWEWFPRQEASELLLSQPRFSLVRARPDASNTSLQLLSPPVRIMGIFPNSSVGVREISKTSTKALEALGNEGARYQPVIRDKATIENVSTEMESFSPHIVHYEGHISYDADLNPSVRLLFSSPSLTTQPIGLATLETLLLSHKVQLLVIGRNESGRLYGNATTPMSYRMIRIAVPAVLAPTRVVDEVTATSLTTEFYRAFIAGNTLEQALHNARRKVAARGGDWTAFALFANPGVLDIFQPIPPAH